MSWNDMNADDLAEVSYPKPGQRLVIRREPGPPRLYVEVNPPRGNKPVLLRMPEPLQERLKRLVSGNRSGAIMVLVEEALDLLEAGDECWRIVAEDIDG